MYRLTFFLVLSHSVLAPFGTIPLVDHPSRRTTTLRPNGGPSKEVPLHNVKKLTNFISHRHQCMDVLSK